METKEELYERLERLAFQKSIPFCYGCHIQASTGRCSHCGSDDLMRLLPGFGCEYGTDWIIKEILSEAPCAQMEEQFEDSIRSCYPEETEIGWLKVDTVAAIKELDPVSWDLVKNEWISSQEEDELLISFDNGSTYFFPSDLQTFLLDLESELDLRSAVIK